jgi:hypothetical protein
MSRYWGIRVGNGWGFKFAEFTSMETCQIVGMSPALLRLWRSRGQVCGGGGKSGTFDAREVAELLIKYELSKFGVSPSNSGEVSCKAAQIMLWFALLNHDGTCEAIGTVADTDSFIERFRDDDSVAALLTDNPKFYQFIIMGSEGEPQFYKELTDDMLAFNSSRSICVISLQKAASDLALGARRPLFTVDVSGEGPEPRVRRLTGQRRLRLVQ